MDIDAFMAVRSGRWKRLEDLASRRRLTGEEADELVRLYQSTATDLSALQSSAPDPNVVGSLSALLARARARIAGAHEPSWRDAARFLGSSLPEALFRLRWWIVVTSAVCLTLGVVTGWWVATNPDVLNSFMTPEQQKSYVDEAFAEYYEPGAGFAAMVWTNNAWIAAQAVGLGISGIWPAFILLNNSVMVGATGGMMAANGELGLFLQLIGPHGQLELTAIFVAGAAGLRLFWTLVDPGGRPRGRALAEEGRALFTVALGLVLVLGLSALVEGFVTGSSLSWVAKNLIGLGALAAFWVYVLVPGRRAVEQGHTGDLSEDYAGASVPVTG